ncbi:hypothetical protein HALO59_50771 [Halomonas sp. 59]|nr:hypothetical protein HALO113_80774 [Halomonas sp. 113]CAD5290693.1 hypothetical protein HALO59_50771 [Halomonas sp. 59]VXB49058.1 hypothetical protein HALO153_150074 [Halomonas titanicae]VXC52355.1 hypothetical protein HALO98_70376 [Halomonas titanicae]
MISLADYRFNYMKGLVISSL